MTTPAAPTRFLLASASPRRRRLIAWLGVPYETVSTDVDESFDSATAVDANALAATFAERKARAAIAAAPIGEDVLVLAFDTLVVLDGELLGKPTDLDDAHRMLRALSGRDHAVVTGVAIATSNMPAPKTRTVATRVSMRALDEEAIGTWAAEGELLGCAGAYNIERHLASVSLDECFQNVAGLPLCHLWRWLTSDELGILAPVGLTNPCASCDESRKTRCRLGASLA